MNLGKIKLSESDKKAILEELKGNIDPKLAKKRKQLLEECKKIYENYK